MELDRYARRLHAVDDVGYTVWTARQRLMAAGDGPGTRYRTRWLGARRGSARGDPTCFGDVPRHCATRESDDSQPWLFAGDEPRVDEVAAELDRFIQLTQSLPTNHPVLGPGHLHSDVRRGLRDSAASHREATSTGAYHRPSYGRPDGSISSTPGGTPLMSGNGATSPRSPSIGQKCFSRH